MQDVALHVPADHPAFAGHFPGEPLLPGVALLAEVLEAVLADPELTRRVGASPRLASAKFLAPVRPGTALRIRLDPRERSVHFEVGDGARVVAAGQFETSQ